MISAGPSGSAPRPATSVARARSRIGERLACADGTLYTGITTALERRLLVHNAGAGSKYTRSRRPVAWCGPGPAMTARLPAVARRRSRPYHEPGSARCSWHRRQQGSRLPSGRARVGGAVATQRSLLQRSLLLGSELGEQLLEGRLLDDAVELRPVVGDQAHALDHHVVGEPAVTGRMHAVVDGNLGPGFRNDLRAHGGPIAVERLTDVLDAIAARVSLDLADVGALEKVGEELHELVALGGGAALPVAAQRSLRQLAEIEQLVGDRPDGSAPVGRPRFLLERGVLEARQEGV